MIDKQQAEFQAMREAYQADLAEARQGAQGLQIAEDPQQPAAGPEISSLAIRLPTFWSTSPALWFTQAEASFDTRNPKVTVDSTKFNHVLQALPQDILTEFEHVIETPGPDHYVSLKAALIKAYGKSRATKNAELLEMSATPGGMGDRRPSHIMMRIRNLSGSSYDAMERAMFLNQLPAEVRTSLASSKAISNDELVSEADAVMEEFKIAKRAASTPRAVTAVASQDCLLYTSPSPRD